MDFLVLMHRRLINFYLKRDELQNTENLQGNERHKTKTGNKFIKFEFYTHLSNVIAKQISERVYKSEGKVTLSTSFPVDFPFL